MHRLENPIKTYDWGSRSAIAELLGQSVPTPEPQAELWMGAHPSAPSRVLGETRTLDRCIAEEPARWLGVAHAGGAFGPSGRATLPFLLKVLAAERPLSLQAHPTRAQAQEGFVADERAGIPLAAPRRNYRDENHKPELLCALTPFSALCGFRDPHDTLLLFAALRLPELEALTRPLARQPDATGLRDMFAALMRMPSDEAQPLVAEVAVAAATAKPEPRFARTLEWTQRLAQFYPHDVGVIAALMLNVIELQPGEAIYLGAGNLHAYLHGVGVEIMANSDNVLRGGLTSKHIDVDELLHVLDFSSGEVPALRPRPLEGEMVYDTPAPEFRLSRIASAPGEHVLSVWGPEILLCTEGEWTAEDGDGPLTLRRGESAFVRGEQTSYRVRGSGSLFRATVGR